MASTPEDSLVLVNPNAPPRPRAPRPHSNPEGAPTAGSLSLGLLVGLIVLAFCAAPMGTVGAVLIATLVAATASAIIQAFMDGAENRRRTRATADTAAWDTQNRLFVGDAPHSELLADMVNTRAKLYATVTASDCVDESWRRVIDIQVWELANQLADSNATRADLTQAERLSVGRPELCDAATNKRAEVNHLDRKVTELRDQLRTLLVSAQSIDAALAAAEQKRADDDEAAALVHKLTGVDPAAEARRATRDARLEIATLAGTDLRLLAAGLDAAREHLAGKHGGTT